MDYKVRKDFKYLSGCIEIPPDKSISHRAVIFSALASGKSIIKNFSDAQDPQTSLQICKNLGADIVVKKDSYIEVTSDGKLYPYNKNLNCSNSGTTMRLLSGILAGQNFNSILTGDESLSKRPMGRIIEPLTLMGANIKSNNFHAPLEIRKSELHAIKYCSPIASAQVKSCILLAGLFAQGTTEYTEPYLSRNHTEIMLKSMGANIRTNKNTTTIEKSELQPLNIEIFGDISSAAFFIVAALIIPKSKIVLKNIGLNKTRAGIIEVVKKMNGNITILDKKIICGEEVGDIQIEYSPDLTGCEISGEIIPRLIDEIPVIALMATQAKGQTIIKDAQDLRNKETDRIKTTVSELKKLGAEIEETNDGMIINGKITLKGDTITDSYTDHRLAMTLYIAGLITEKEISIKNFEWIKISFPEFTKLIESLKIG